MTTLKNKKNYKDLCEYKAYQKYNLIYLGSGDYYDFYFNLYIKRIIAYEASQNFTFSPNSKLSDDYDLDYMKAAQEKAKRYLVLA